MVWIRLSMDATQEAVDWIITLLRAKGYGGDVQVRPYDAASLNPNALPAEWAFTVDLYILETGSVQRTISVQRTMNDISDWLSSLVRVGLVALHPPVWVDEKSPESGGFLSRVGQRLVIVSPATPYTPQPDELVLTLEWGRAFGSGLHPATVVALRSLEQHVRPGMHGLDLGSGSGILSVAMAKLGATVTAIDNDPAAVEATQRTVSHHLLEHQITVLEGSLGKGRELGHWMGNAATATATRPPGLTPAGCFDLVVANILARVHIALAEDFRAALRQTAPVPRLLITSGFTTDYEQDIDKALHQVGFEAIGSERSQEWVALTHQLNA